MPILLVNALNGVAVSDSCLPPIVAPKAPTLITAANAARYETCLTGLMHALCDHGSCQLQRA